MSPRRIEPREPLLATALGWGLDGFDFYLYVYALPAIITAFGLTRSQGGLLATFTLAASAVGGITAGTLADRIGRRNVLMLSIAWYALFTFLSGVSQNYTQLAILRGLEGLGFGGEWAVGSVLISEWANAATRGRALGFMQSAWACGWLAANATFQIVFSLAAPDPGWRYLFFLGILPAISILYVRRSISDPPGFERRSFTLPRIFAPAIVRTTIAASVLAIGVQTGYYALFTWMPAYLVSQRHMPPLTSGSYLYLLIAGSFVGYVSAGYINDLFGRRRTFVVFSLCSAILTPLYLYFVVADWQLLIAGPVLGFFASGIFSGFGPYLSELFPSTMRGAAQGFCYNVGRGIAGLGPLIVGAIAGRYAIGTAMSGVAIAAYLLAVIAVLFLPETRGAELRTV